MFTNFFSIRRKYLAVTLVLSAGVLAGALGLITASLDLMVLPTALPSDLSQFDQSFICALESQLPKSTPIESLSGLCQPIGVLHEIIQAMNTRLNIVGAIVFLAIGTVCAWRMQATDVPVKNQWLIMGLCGLEPAGLVFLTVLLAIPKDHAPWQGLSTVG